MTITNYPVGDFFIRIKNAALARNREFVVDNTKLIKEVAKVLKKAGFLQEVKEDKKRLTVHVAYQRKEPVVLDIKLVSRPGLRIYSSVDELEKKKGPSIYILSTPEGVMTSKEAIKKRIGGEVMAELW